VRFRRAIAFVAIVWAVAATFVLFEIVALSATSLMLSFQDLFGTLVLPREVTQSKTCIVAKAEQRDAPATTAASTALTASWLLGVAVGRDAVARQITNERRFLDPSEETVRGFARGLGTPVPAFFVPRQIAMANREFVSFIEADGQRTAHTLAVRYSARACDLYKLGAVWGFSEMERPVLVGERAVFAPQIRYYAREAALPESLWQPMMRPTSSDATRDQLITETTALTKAVTSHLMTQR
jgi:hypothetical protein